MTTVSLNPGAAHLTDWRAILDGATASLGGESAKNIASGQKIVEEIVAAGTVTYGVNTGFGKLASVRIADADLAKLQSNLIVSHAVGTGPALPDGVVRLLLAMKAASLARGASGVRPVVIEALTNALKADALPVIPAKGSVGASGDLAPLAHMAAAVCGFAEAEAVFKGRRVPAREALAKAGLAPDFPLGAKDASALINGSTVSLALGVLATEDAKRLIKAAETTGTFKYRKADLVADGFDPTKTGTALYVRGGKTGYQKLTQTARKAILSGETRL